MNSNGAAFGYSVRKYTSGQIFIGFLFSFGNLARCHAGSEINKSSVFSLPARRYRRAVITAATTCVQVRRVEYFRKISPAPVNPDLYNMICIRYMNYTIFLQR